MEMKHKRTNVGEFIQKVIDTKGPVFVLNRLGCENEVVGKVKDMVKQPDTFADPIFQMGHRTAWCTAIREETLKTAKRIAKEKGAKFVVDAIYVDTNAVLNSLPLFEELICVSEEEAESRRLKRTAIKSLTNEKDDERDIRMREGRFRTEGTTKKFSNGDFVVEVGSSPRSVYFFTKDGINLGDSTFCAVYIVEVEPGLYRLMSSVGAGPSFFEAIDVRGEYPLKCRARRGLIDDFGAQAYIDGRWQSLGYFAVDAEYVDKERGWKKNPPSPEGVLAGKTTVNGKDTKTFLEKSLKEHLTRYPPTARHF